MSQADIRRIARELLEALDDGNVVPSVVERYPGFGWDEGYAVAAEVGKLRRERGETPAGRKVGFTNRNIWPEYGATSPIWAHVYDTTLVHAVAGHAIVSLAKSVAPRIEPEIAFKLRAPVPAGCDDPAAILRSLEWLAPSFEIVAKQPAFDALAGGEIVTTGTLTAALPVKPGEIWSSVYSGLPVTGLEIKFTA